MVSHELYITGIHILPTLSCMHRELFTHVHVPVIGEESVGEYEPSLLVAFDVVGPFQQPPSNMFRHP